jgi:phosphomannomutase
MDRHFRKILDYVDAPAIRARSFKVAVDCCNGVGALFSAAFLRDRLGCRVLPLFDEPSGAFERDPEPLAENLSRLCEQVRAGSCDIGFAQDPDGDRLAVVTETGEALVEDLTLALVLQQVLERHEKGPVAVNLSCSQCIDDVARAAGSTVFRTRIGEINVSEAILEHGAVAGGENTGGVIIPRIHPCRDSFAGMAVLLELLAQSGRSVSQLCQAIPRYFLVKDKVPARAGQVPAMYRAVRRLLADQKLSFLDGIYAELDGTWLHVRRSNTEPVVRITVESRDEAQGRAWLERVRSEIQAVR